MIHRVGDVQEMLPELAGDVLVSRIFAASSIAIASRFRQYIAIQPVPSACSMMPAGGQRGAAVEDADVVQPQEAALEDVAAFGVLAVHPPGEVQQQLVEDALRNARSPLPRRFWSIL